jgi:hypothetical protein
LQFIHVALLCEFTESRLNKKLKTKSMTTLSITNSISRSPLRLGFLLMPLVLAWFALAPTGQAQLPSPAPDGGYPGDNTAEGDSALSSVTTSGYFGSNNTAIGSHALFSNTTGYFNTANGFQALFSNTTGENNTANGVEALWLNTTGGANTANGFAALVNNTTGRQNTANGGQALYHNTTGYYNIALGYSAGLNLTTGNNNIDIGNEGVADEANTIRIGTQVSADFLSAHTNTFIAGISGVTVSGGAPVVVDTTGHLGTATSALYRALRVRRPSRSGRSRRTNWSRWPTRSARS